MGILTHESVVLIKYGGHFDCEASLTQEASRKISEAAHCGYIGRQGMVLKALAWTGLKPSSRNTISFILHRCGYQGLTKWEVHLESEAS